MAIYLNFHIVDYLLYCQELDGGVSQCVERSTGSLAGEFLPQLVRLCRNNRTGCIPDSSIKKGPSGGERLLK